MSNVQIFAGVAKKTKKGLISTIKTPFGIIGRKTKLFSKKVKEGFEWKTYGLDKII